MPAANPEFLEILETLHAHRVAFIIIGGVCGVLHGAPINTLDLDIVHSRAPENVDRLVAALQALDAYYREPGNRRLRPKAEYLQSSGHHLFTTRVGPLDVLGTVGTDLTYDDLLPHSEDMDLGEGLSVRVLNLDWLIRLKEEVGREKDKAVLAILRRTWEERK